MIKVQVLVVVTGIPSSGVFLAPRLPERYTRVMRMRPAVAQKNPRTIITSPGANPINGPTSFLPKLFIWFSQPSFALLAIAMPVRQWIRRLKGTPRPSGQLEGIEHGGNNQADASTLSNAIPASSTSVDASPAPISSFIAVSNARPELEPALVIVDRSSRSPEHLWDLAYDELKVNDAALVDAYEKILSCHLCDRDPESDGDVDEENIIAQGDPGARRAQMEQLVTSGLVKIKREAKMKESLDKGMQVVMSAKEVIRSAIQTIPQAALAWTGVCVALEVRLCIYQCNKRVYIC